MRTFAPESCHEHLLKAAPRSLAFHSQRDFQTWRQKVDAKLRELIGVLPERVPLDITIEYEQASELFREIRFVFAAEANADVPCHLLIPQEGEVPFPVVICLQGHSTGMHISLGRIKYEGDKESITHYAVDHAIQAVREGYAALVMEQRCFGERLDRRPLSVHPFEHPCRHAAMVALLLGRTMIGERTWDVSRAIDALHEFPEIDTGCIGCVGASGGGTITYFASCLDNRINIAMPGCFVCTFRDSIGMIDHCEDNYIPDILRFFEMGDLACLIAPRSLVVVAGREDDIFPIGAVEETFDTIQQIYAAAGVPGRCRLLVGEGGHIFFPDLAWPVFRELAEW